MSDKDTACESIKRFDSSGIKRLRDIEREHILATLFDCRGKRDRTAKTLGISYRKLTTYLAAYRKEGWKENRNFGPKKPMPDEIMTPDELAELRKRVKKKDPVVKKSPIHLPLIVWMPGMSIKELVYEIALIVRIHFDSVEMASKSLGVDRKTLYRWTQDAMLWNMEGKPVLLDHYFTRKILSDKKNKCVCDLSVDDCRVCNKSPTLFKTMVFNPPESHHP